MSFCCVDHPVALHLGRTCEVTPPPPSSPRPLQAVRRVFRKSTPQSRVYVCARALLDTWGAAAKRDSPSLASPPVQATLVRVPANGATPAGLALSTPRSLPSTRKRRCVVLCLCVRIP